MEVGKEERNSFAAGSLAVTTVVVEEMVVVPQELMLAGTATTKRTATGPANMKGHQAVHLAFQ